MIRFLIALVFSCQVVYVMAQLPAFPGAEGHGRYASGGRGGKVYFVTSLDDGLNTPGTFRWALNQPSPKIILFKVSGTIFLKSSLSISKGNVTIAGQSAPGDGICIAGFPVNISSNNVVIRYLRFRMGDISDLNADGSDALGGRRTNTVIIDHCSMSWSTDECSSFYENENFTMQWCILAESLRLSGHSKGPHGYGGIWGGVNASFHHNLVLHHDSRTPRFGPGTTTQLRELTDYRNNVIYNYGGLGCYGGEGMKINLVNNYYKPGPATPSGIRRGRIFGPDMKMNLPSSDGFYPINNRWGQFYVEGNFFDGSTSPSTDDQSVCSNATNDNWSHGIYNQFDSKYNVTQAQRQAMKAEQSFDAGTVTTHNALIAFEKVLAHAGCSHRRDEHDQRMVAETRSGTAAFKGLSVYNGYSNNYPGSTTDWKSKGYPKWGIIDSQQDLKPQDASANWSAWPELKYENAPADLDEDGMPDDWEVANGLNPNDASDANKSNLDGQYTNVEVYLYRLVESSTADQLSDGVKTSAQNIGRNTGNNFDVRVQLVHGGLMVQSSRLLRQAELYSLSGLLKRRFLAKPKI